MLHAFTFKRVAILVRHWFEVGLDDGVMEHGARLELRLLQPSDHRGTESAAQRIVVDQPVWRADLFDRLDKPAGTFSAAHFHPVFDGVEPCDRSWSKELTIDPWSWLLEQLRGIDELCRASGVDPNDVREDVAAVRAHAPEIIAVAQTYAPDECTSVETCHAWTSDVADAVRLMVSNMTDVSRLNRGYTAPWLDERLDAAAYADPDPDVSNQ